MERRSISIQIVPNCALYFSLPPDCLLVKLSLFDLFQVLGVLSLVLFVFFVRSQYLRVEQVREWGVVWGVVWYTEVLASPDVTLTL